MVSGIAFLMYHELELPGRGLCHSDPGYTRYIVPVSAFEGQLRYLKSLGFQGVSVGDALTFTGERKFVITFDDGCETDLIAAAPILAKFAFGGTFYITVGFLGRRGYMSESQLRELSDFGFEIGCHSMTHAYLPDLDTAGQEREIVEAKLRLEHITGLTTDHFSCPGGRFDQRVLNTARRAGYRTLATSLPFLNTQSTNLYALGRVAVHRDTQQERLARICRGIGFWRMNLQQSAQDAAKSVLGNRLYDRLRTAVLLKRGHR
jgi:peptidoglycan/xylan/chitin deacetylase (PgdA/CDA1 family)